MPEKLNAKQKEIIEGVPITGRKVEDYCFYLQVEEDYFDKKGQIILDIGSGYNQDLARNVEYMGLGAEIISIDPSLTLNTERQDFRRKEAGKFHPLTIAAYAKQLPFADNSVDKCLALFSVPMYSVNTEYAIAEIKEMIRLVKKGGEIRIFPFKSGSYRDRINYEELKKIVTNIPNCRAEFGDFEQLLVLKRN